MEKRNLIIHLLIVFILSAAAIAQPPDSLWSRAYGGYSHDVCCSMQQTSDGGYILAGSTESFGAGIYDILMVKTDADGDSLWSRTYGGDDWDRCWSVQQTFDGGYVLAGDTYSYGSGCFDFWLVKTDSSGNKLWGRIFGGRANDHCTAARQTSDSGYVLVGYTYSFGAGSADYWLIRTNSRGDSLWGRTFGGDRSDRCESVIETLDGGFLLAGYTYSFNVSVSDIWLVKADNNGDSLWSRTYGGSDFDNCCSIQRTSDGGYVLAGETKSFGDGNQDIWLIKTDSNGDSLWSRIYGSSDWDNCRWVQQTVDGGFVLAGDFYSSDASSPDFRLVKTDAGGDSLWSCTFGGSESEACYSVQQTTDGGYVLAGYTESFGAGGCDFWLVKTGPDGTPVWDRQVSTPQQFSLSVYPNPFNPITTISFDLPRAMQTQLRIFDVTGRIVTTLADERFSAGSYSFRFDGGPYPSGVYFARLQADNQQKTQKLILLK